MRYECTAERFLGDVKGHVMRVHLNDGINRRLTFGKPGDSNMWFCIATFNNVLVYYGDMGSYVFSRIEDMFKFFRRPGPIDRDSINPQYWSEKVLSVDRHHAIEVFSEEEWVKAIRYDVKSYLENEATGEEGSWFELARVIWPAVKEELIKPGASNLQEAVESVNRFEIEGHQPFSDFFYENNLTEYGYHFLWCCYAIVWGIQQFDALDSSTSKE